MVPAHDPGLARRARDRTVTVRSALVDRLVAEARGQDIFEATTVAWPRMPRLFGGEVVARALAAAQGTVAIPLTVHSLHSHFLREGLPGVPLRLRVARLRDGRSFSTRQVTVTQNDREILALTASFHRDEPGPDVPTPFPTGVPGPEEAIHQPTPFDDHPARSPLDIVEMMPFLGPHEGWTHRRAWVRTREHLPADASIHVRALAYVTDVSTAFVPLRATGIDLSTLSLVTSLEHSLWVHRTPRADEWMLVEMNCTAARNSRGLTWGTVHGADGTHIATLSQESLLRSRRPSLIRA